MGRGRRALEPKAGTDSASSRFLPMLKMPKDIESMDL